MTPDQIAERHTLSHVKHEWPDSGSIYVCTCGEEFDQLNFHARHIADAMLAGVLGPAEPLAEWERELLSPFPAGLTVSEDGVVLNWRGENYVRQSELVAVRYTAAARLARLAELVSEGLEELPELEGYDDADE